MLDYIVDKAKQNYLDLINIINGCKTEIELINKIRLKDAVIEEQEGTINIYQDELKVIVDVKNNIVVKEVLIFDENKEDYIQLEIK